MSWTHQFTSGNVPFWFLGMCPGGNETQRIDISRMFSFQQEFFFFFCEQKLVHCCLGIPWISWTALSGFQTKSEKIGCQLDGRVMSYSATRWMLERTGGSVGKCWDQRNQPWMKSCFGIGNPPILKKNDLNTQVNVLTTAYTFLIFSLVIVKLFGGPSSSFLGWIRKKGRSETCIELMCLESMLSNETMNTASINSWLFN